MVKPNSILWTILLFLFVVFFIELIYFKDVYLVITNDLEKYSFKNFVIYNFIFKVIGYIFKFLFLFAFFKFILLVFDLNDKINLLKIILLSETIYVLTLKGFIIIYCFLINNQNIDVYFLSNYEKYVSLAYYFNDSLGNFSIKYVLGSITLFDLIYVFFLVFLFAESLKIKFLKSFKQIGLGYLMLLLFIGIVKTFMSI